MEKESVRRHIQDLPLKTSHISDYNVGVSALADALFFFLSWKVHSMIETSCSAGMLCGGRKGCHRNSSAGKRLLMQLWEALPVQG